jgi:sugar phosphate isomerase/epimerase
MKFGFSTHYFTKKGPLAMMEEAISHGVRVFELSREIPHVLGMDGKFLAEVEALRGQGIEFSMHAPFFEINLGSFFEEIRSISMKKIKESLRVAGRIGASPVVVHPGYTFLVNKVKAVEDRTRENFLEDLAEVSAFAALQGVRIGLENVHMPYFFFYGLQDFGKILERVPGVGMTLDVGHAYVNQCAEGARDPEGAILSGIERIGIDHLVHVHLHGNAGLKDDHAFLETHADLGRIVSGLGALGYREKVIVESYDMERHGMEPVLRKLGGLKV